jgi:two-component system response regulator FlrC
MSSTEGQKGPVLVVDDDNDIRTALRDTLESEGYAVHEARDGTDALSYLKTSPLPPLVLLDWNMAPMNAPQFMQELALAALPALPPIVLLTADARADEKVKSAAYAGFLKKPVVLDALFDVVRRFIP